MVKWNRICIIMMIGILVGGSWPVCAKDESEPLCEDRSVYQKGFGGSITYLYVTVLNLMTEDGIVIPFSAVNSYQYTPEKACPEAQVIIQEGNSKHPILEGFLGIGTIKVRGKSTTHSEQKSFKIKLDKASGGWEGQTEINLNKHVYDLTRVRNKLSFDYFKVIPNMTSLRTRFVNVWVKDMTAKHPDGKFVNYGLFTQIEEPGKEFLKAHGLDPEGNLYKAEDFDFRLYPENLKDKDDPTYSKRLFEQKLEICGSKDHRKLLKMVDDLNNEEIPIEEIIARYFDLDNLTTWLAVNIIMGNKDTSSQNYFLYSPSNSNRWYLLPWDYDDTWGTYGQLGSKNIPAPLWRLGISNYWGMTLFNRMFRVPQYVQALSVKVELVAAIVNEEKTKEMLKNYHSVVSPFVIHSPDSKQLPGGIGAYEFEYRRIAKEPELNHQIYYVRQENPMPYFLLDPEINSNEILFAWEASFDLQGDQMTYVFQLSEAPDFAKIIDEQKMNSNEYIRNLLAPGTYYYRVIAYDSKGNSQLGFDDFVDAKGKIYFGVRQFIIK